MKKLIKKILPIEKIRIIKSKMNTKLMKRIVKINFLTSVYYIFTGEFNREHKSVLMGKLKHLEDMNNKTSNHFLLRRNIHRLEKGLIMRPMRKVFAVGYIEETVFCYKALLIDFYNNKTIALSELKWAKDVLTKYFKVTDNHKTINKMEDIFNNLEHVTFQENNDVYIPYTRDLGQTPSVSYDSLLDLAKFRRSVRWFKDKKVPTEIIDNAVNVANLAPSACNRQPFRFRFFDESSQLKKITELPMGTKGYSDNIPIMAAVIGDLSAYPFERDRHLIYIDSSLAAMSFILALETQGVSSCIINWPDIETREKEISELLNLYEHERITMLIAFGYPDELGKVAYSKKKDLDEIRIYN